MKRFVLVFIINVILNHNGTGQNLVPNGGFETILTCDSLFGAISYGLAPPWDSPSKGSPDVFSSCATDNMSIPSNYFGYQYPHSGMHYAGEGLYQSSSPDFEYIQVKLDSPLIAQQLYCASFYVNLSSKSGIAINNIGMYFSLTHTSVLTFNNLSFIPQINDTAIVNDTVNWKLIYGQYIAQGGEQYIIIGNFYPTTLTDTTQLNHPYFRYTSYYYIDDVNLHCCSCDSLNHEDISEINNLKSEILISPNPATSSITIISSTNIKEIKLINLLGECVLSPPPSFKEGAGGWSVDISSLSKGIYFVEITDAKKTVVNRKIVVQ